MGFIESVCMDRIEGRLEDLWDIGREKNRGVTRAAYSKEETEAFEYIRSEIPISYEVETDRFGNMYATREPNAEQHLYLGSHLDTVYNGGKYDGALGVVTALEAIEVVYNNDKFNPTVPLKLAVWRGEEPPRFGKGSFGCRSALGRMTKKDLKIKDKKGISVQEAMESCDLTPTNPSESSIDTDKVQGFLETHIEQARILEESENNVGVVTSIRGPVRHRITVYGEYDHSGATPMDNRRDALVGAAEMLTDVCQIATRASEEDDLVATVGNLSPKQGQITAVCGEITFPIDLRSNNLEYRNAVEKRIHKQVRSIAERYGLSVDIEMIDREKPVHLNTELVNLLDKSAKKLGIPHQRLPSGAGHDSRITQLAGIPTAMLFTPSIDGISHSPEEETPIESVEDVTKILAYAVANYK